MNKRTDLFFSKTQRFLSIYLTAQNNKSFHTVKSYRDSLTIFQRYIKNIEKMSIKTFMFSDCTRELLLRYIAYLREKMAISSVNNKISAIKAYLWFSADEDIELQPMAIMASRIPSLKSPKVVKPILSPDVMKDFLSSSMFQTEKEKRDQVILILLYQTAARANELSLIRLKDVNLREKVILLHGKGDKERPVTFDECALSFLKNYINAFHKQSKPDDFLFYTKLKNNYYQMSVGNIERIVRKYSDILREKHSDLPKRIYPHMFRRTRATNLYQDGVELELVSRYLGHASTVTTRIYAQPSIEMLRDLMEKANPLSDIHVEKTDLLERLTEEDVIKMCGLRP